MKKIIKYIALTLLLGMIVIQFIARPEKITEPLDPQHDMITLLDVQGPIKDIIESTCYDCHSDQPTYPWYSGIAPVSWWMEETHQPW